MKKVWISAVVLVALLALTTAGRRVWAECCVSLYYPTCGELLSQASCGDRCSSSGCSSYDGFESYTVPMPNTPPVGSTSFYVLYEFGPEVCGQMYKCAMTDELCYSDIGLPLGYYCGAGEAKSMTDTSKYWDYDWDDYGCVEG